VIFISTRKRRRRLKLATIATKEERSVTMLHRMISQRSCQSERKHDILERKRYEETTLQSESELPLNAHCGIPWWGLQDVHQQEAWRSYPSLTFTPPVSAQRLSSTAGIVKHTHVLLRITPPLGGQASCDGFKSHCSGDMSRMLCGFAVSV
jgi:hypothetical protein